jgi:hypothetical protein
MTHRITTITGLVTATAAAAVLGTLNPAQAHPTCTEGAVRCTATSVSPYAEPIHALGGRSLAKYLADHMNRRLA